MPDQLLYKKGIPSAKALLHRKHYGEKRQQHGCSSYLRSSGAAPHQLEVVPMPQPGGGLGQEVADSWRLPSPSPGSCCLALVWGQTETQVKPSGSAGQIYWLMDRFIHGPYLACRLYVANPWPSLFLMCSIGFRQTSCAIMFCTTVEHCKTAAVLHCRGSQSSGS